MEDRSQTATTVLVVDDEPILRETIAYNLKREGFNVDVAADGEEALEIARETNPDVIVLDIMLPKMDGLQVLRTIRDESPVPILLLSARSDEIDRVLGLELGADDYLPKPFAMRELVARVKAILRRSEGGRRPQDAIVVGNLAVDRPRREAKVAGKSLELRTKEFDLLVAFSENAGIVLTREQLLESVWGYEYAGETRTVDVHVQHLRSKLNGATVSIETLRGVGYKLIESPG